MDHYELAEQSRPAGDDACILRWNACARVINEDPDVCPEPEVPSQPLLASDDSFGAE